MDSEIVSLLELWKGKALRHQNRHMDAHRRNERVYKYVVIASTVLTAFVGGSVATAFKSVAGEWTGVIIGSIGVVAAALTGVQSIMRFDRRAEQHRKASHAFGALRREIESRQFASADADPSEERAFVERLRKKWDAIVKKAPAYRADSKASQKDSAEYAVAMERCKTFTGAKIHTAQGV